MHKVQHVTEQELDLLRYFYEHRKGHVRQVKKAVKLSEHTLLKYLNSLNIDTPRHGTVEELGNRTDFPFIESVVIYTDEFAHCGEGKIKTSLHEALKKYPGCYSSEFILTALGGASWSLRYLQIGDRAFWLRYHSHDDWRSNCGDIDIDMVVEEENKAHKETIKQKINKPLFAVDFVTDFSGKLYAIDFNTAPSWRGSGVEKLISGKEIVEALKRWHTEEK